MSVPAIFYSQIVLNQIDDFEDFTTRNWTKNNTVPNANISTGGPLGIGDNFLRVNSTGTGANLQLMTLNNAQWTGNYYQSNSINRITYISMDVRNSGTNVIFLRISFKKIIDSSTIEIWCTTNAIAVLPGEPWKKVNFQINEASVVRVSGINPYSTTFSGVQEARILHNDAPAWDSDLIEATLDIDNIMARNSAFLGTDVMRLNNKLILFPNPANDHVKIYNENSVFENFDYKIIDFVGRIIKNGISKTNEEINVTELNSGNYILRIKTETGDIMNEKFIRK